MGVMCKLYADNVAGVSLPAFKLIQGPQDAALQTLGVAHGGAVISACRETYLKAVVALIKLASLQTSFKTLDEEIKMTSRRVNALEYVLIPRIEVVWLTLLRRWTSRQEKSSSVLRKWSRRRR